MKENIRANMIVYVKNKNSFADAASNFADAASQQSELMPTLAEILAANLNYIKINKIEEAVGLYKDGLSKMVKKGFIPEKHRYRLEEWWNEWVDSLKINRVDFKEVYKQVQQKNEEPDEHVNAFTKMDEKPPEIVVPKSLFVEYRYELKSCKTIKEIEAIIRISKTDPNLSWTEKINLEREAKELSKDMFND